MKKNEIKSDVSHLLCREIQAPLVSALIKGFAGKIGEDKTLAIAADVIREDAISAGKALAQKYSGNSLAVLLKVVKEVWAQDGTMEIENIKLTENTLHFDVTRCGYAEMYKRLGIPEMGCLLSCSRDFPFMDGFNRKIELVRTRTIMEGAPYCDFRYHRK